MQIIIANVLAADDITMIVAMLSNARFVDGRATAGFAAQARIEKEAGFQSSPVPGSRPPEINSGDGKPKEREITGSGDGARGRPSLTFLPEPAVPVSNIVKPIVEFGLVSQDSARVRIDVDGAATAEIDRN